MGPWPLRPDRAQAGGAAGLWDAARTLESDLLRVELDDDGTLRRVFDKRAGREALAGRGNRIWAYVDKPRSWDAWDIDESYARQGEQIPAAEIAVAETGPHQAAIRVVRHFRDSEIVQHLRLWANSARLDIATDIDWHDRRILLKARFPLAIRSDYATFECAHGVIRPPRRTATPPGTPPVSRSPHTASPTSPSQDTALPCSTTASTATTRSAVSSASACCVPRCTRTHSPTRGAESFTYALLPHAGDWLTGGVLAEAEDLNQPLLATPVIAAGSATWTAASVTGLTLGLSAFKPTEGGDALLLRTYEPAGARGSVAVALPDGWRISGEANVLEDPVGKPELSFLPFKLHTWTIERS